MKLLNMRGKWEEVHISSERMVRNNRLGCTAERTDENVMEWLQNFKEVLKDIAFHSDDNDYLEYVKSTFYNDNIIAFTPNGDSVKLPKNATALDLPSTYIPKWDFMLSMHVSTASCVR